MEDGETFFNGLLIWIAVAVFCGMAGFVIPQLHDALLWAVLLTILAAWTILHFPTLLHFRLLMLAVILYGVWHFLGFI